MLAALASWLPGQRWFAGGGRTIVDLRFAQLTQLASGPQTWQALVAVTFDGGECEVYQVPLLRDPRPKPDSLIGDVGDGYLHDGLCHGALVRELLSQCHWSGEVPALGSYRLLAGEHSNTIGILADTVLVKAYRRLHPGRNPDIEVHERLTQVGNDDVGRLLGWLSGQWDDPRSPEPQMGDLLMVQEYLPDAQAGWDLACRMGVKDEPFDAADLGATTARVHAALSAAFPTAQVESGVLADRLAGRLAAAVAEVRNLRPLAGALQERIDRVRDLPPVTVQRVHGDYHLGQTLWTARGWRVLDFEGEPGATVSERRRRDHPLRDVAGMLRSFSYAAARSGSPARWASTTASTFLTGYGREVVQQALLDAYLVDKAAYEAVYERRHRPQWLPIPMAALQDLSRD